jgi:beta-barrel assembly-enhancing protease
MQSGISARAGCMLLAVLLAAPGAVARGKDKKKDPEQIGARDVGKGVNLYSFEKEIALGKQMAQEVEREAKIVEDPVIAST